MAKNRQKEEEAEEELEEGPGKERLNLLIDSNLKRWAQEYAKDHCTSVTAIVTSHLVELRKKSQGVDVEQI